ncbi:MAG: hypothetical protein KDD66_00460 [Bdellovibrionales bacterium]|nr:hypothetical protein [Bdellovibrionales bacterium]
MGGLRKVILGLVLLVPTLAAAQLPPLPDPHWLGEDINTFHYSADTIARTYAAMPSVGAKVNQRYSRLGNHWNGNSYDEHPWINKNPAELLLDHWIIEDTDNVFLSEFENFWECLDFKPVGACGSIFNPGIRFEYWMPQEVTETNNFGVGIFASPMRPLFETFTKLLLPPFLHNLTDNQGNPASLPSEFGDSPHFGNTHIDTNEMPMNMSYHLEAHTYRLFAEGVINSFLSRICRRCFPPGIDEKMKLHFTEFLLSPMWRIPELSMLRGFNLDFSGIAQDPGMITQFVQDIGQMFLDPNGAVQVLGPTGTAMAVGLAYHGTSKSPFLPQSNAPYINLLPVGTCASYRALHGNPIASGLARPNPSVYPFNFPGMDKICYPSPLGQLYPLVGDVDVNSLRVAHMLASRRMLEWTSWNAWRNLPAPLSNVMTQTSSVDESTDKWNRIYPSPSECFRFRDSSERNTSKFPKGMYTENLDDDIPGETRTVRWKRHTCCIKVFTLCF